MKMQSIRIASGPTRLQQKARQRANTKDAQLEQRLQDLNLAMTTTREASAALRKDVTSHEQTDQMLQWAFPAAVLVGLAGGYFGSARVLLGGLAAAAGSHFVRMVHSGSSLDLHSRLVELGKETAALAQDATEVASQRQELKEDLAEQLKAIDILNGKNADGLGIEAGEDRVLVGDFELTRWS